MTISILTIGDEICIGQIVNGNAAWLAEQCTQRGWRVAAHSVVGDTLPVIVSEIDRLMAFSDVLFVTGGLGPTHDDLTRDALAVYFNDTLELNQDAFAVLKERLELRGREVTPRQTTQVIIPSTSRPLFNDRGTAPGLRMERDGKLLFAMPGVPSEMQYISSKYIFPELEQRGSGRTVIFSTLQTSGIIESSLADLIGNPDDFLEGQELAFLPSTAGVRLRVGVTADSHAEAEVTMQRIEEYLYSCAGKYIYGRGGETLASATGRKLKALGRTVAVAESCTGGLLGAALTETPGSSAYFMGGVQVYSNEAKMNLLRVPADVLNTAGAVSRETAELLAANVRALFGTDYGIGITGIAGPDGSTPDKPVGTVWLSLANAHSVQAVRYIFGNDRRVNRELSVTYALWMLYSVLSDEELLASTSH